MTTTTLTQSIIGVRAKRIGLFRSVREDVAWVLKRDPAAKNWIEVLLCYAGLRAVWAYRVHHWLWCHSVRTLARFLSEVARFLTGVEIHPGAQIGRCLFIDHGTGVVIGETAIVGDGVTLYQGVTLGGNGKEQGKSHPTIGNNVVIGVGAKVLGNIIVGENCRVGAGSVVLQDVPRNSTVVGIPGQVVFQNGRRVTTNSNPDNDLLTDALRALLSQVRELTERVRQLETGRESSNDRDTVELDIRNLPIQRQ
jgi:serine O-acetyltransferase